MNTEELQIEENLFNQAIEQFQANTGLEVHVIKKEYPVGKGRFLDALIDLRIGDRLETYAVEVKRRLTAATLGLAVEQLRCAPYKGLLITDHINPKMAERLKEMEIAFMDIAGNAYLKEPPAIVFIKGNRLTEARNMGRAVKPTRAFKQAGLKLIFGLLVNPKLLEKTYREIADTTNVALGTVAEVFGELEDHGYLYERDGKRRLANVRKVIDEWVTAYPDRLRHKILLGRFRAPDHRWWEGVELDPDQAQWGGEVAAERLTRYLKPAMVIIYADRLPTRLIAEERLQKDPEGDVEILQRFWGAGLIEPDKLARAIPKDVVPPLLVYADLMTTADDRNIETANLIYNEFLNGHFQQF
jgi:hypothetical protein